MIELETNDVVEAFQGEPVKTSDVIGVNLYDRVGRKCGKVADVLFDDEKWTIRYLVADTGGFFNREKFLVSPWQLRSPSSRDRTEGIFTVLSKKEVESSPPLDTDAPVSRQYEREIAEYYEYPEYWVGPSLWGVFAIPRARKPSAEERERHEREMDRIRECHLRSVKKVTGYDAFAGVDGETVGKVDDFIFDSKTWKIHVLVLKTGSLLSRKYIALNHEWVSNISWELEQVRFDSLSHSVIDILPSFDS